MLFNSVSFYTFFIVILGFHYLPVSWKVKKTALLLGSYIFYAAWNPPFIFLLWISTIIDWQVARYLYAMPEENRTSRKLALIVSLVANLGLLGYFKYGVFIMENFQHLFQFWGLDYQPAPFSIILPVGISFYTFQSLSYSLDVYFRRIKPTSNFLDFALYVSFFPQLVAGPIVRSEEFLPQCSSERRATANEFGWGIFLLTFGLFQKAVLADIALAPIVEDVFSSRLAHNFLNDWTGVLAFSMQIYFDFNGYTNCAIGTALALGFHLPRNFHFPYAATGFSDFWRRWHISLSSWLRDYLYIPLGGNRSNFSGTAVNIMITMLLGGLWHGASWNFVIWGGLHGCYLILERLYRRLNISDFSNKSLNRSSPINAIFTFLVISLTWIFFRSLDLGTSWEILKGLVNFNFEGKNLKITYVFGITIMSILLLWRHWKFRDSTIENIFAEKRQLTVGLLWIGMIITIIYIRGGGGNAFIYFQF
ncbi:MAG: MBOAT family protein [Leptospiraceae bacterium]|nr:MBOAT family protein [Leptospiraceae bacterium]MCP5497390.1 MBOAT family protein [Leptospiraceae bacterium]